MAVQPLVSDALPETLDVIEHALFGGEQPPNVGRFDIRRQLGRGGMGVVYLAWDPSLSREVAVKVHRSLRADVSNDALLAEAEASAGLRHPNIATVFEVGRTNAGLVFMVMEYLPGPNLREWLTAQPRSELELRGVLVACARGLAAAHRAGIVHRDFKPSNVVLTDDGIPKLIDFGLARASPPESPPSLETLPGDSEASQLAGTPGYFAPEVWRMQLPSEASDQFAFCVSVFELFSGSRPFPKRDYDVLPKRPRSMSRALWRTVRRGLQEHPTDRWPSMDALGDRLDPPRRGPRSAALGVGALAVLGGGLWLSRPAPSAPLSPIACPTGRDLLADPSDWVAYQPALTDLEAGSLELRLKTGPSTFITTRSEEMFAMQDKAVVFEVDQAPQFENDHELLLTLRTEDDTLFAGILLVTGGWLFPLGPNIEGIYSHVEYTKTRFYRVQVEPELHRPYIVTLAHSDDGETWQGIARFRTVVQGARVMVQVGSNDPVTKPESVRVTSIRCDDAVPIEMPEPRRDLTRKR